MNYLGIDIGTSGCKAIIFDQNGQQLTGSHREYQVIHSDDGGAELDSDDVMVKCFEVIQECIANIDGASVKALAVSSQGEAFTAVGSGGESLCHAMVSSDHRALQYVAGWTDKFGKEKLYQITGHTAHPIFTLFKLQWLKEQRPDVWRNSQHFFCFEDLLQFRLGLEPAISWPLAGRTLMFDVRKHQWDSEILKELGISTRQLATPLPSGSVAGKIAKDVSRKLGLPEDVLVVTGGHDQPCGALGAGVTDPGLAMYSTGSVECITPAFTQPIFHDEWYRNNLCTYDHTVKGMYTTVAFSLTGGNILQWFRDEFGAAEIAESRRSGVNAYELLLQVAGDNPSGLLVLPYFTPSGTPYFNTHTRGAVFGLRLSSSRGDFIRALLEGVAFEMRLNLEILEKSGLKVTELRAIGGGARSKLWNQLKADVMGKTITTLNVTEAGCLGAAMLACSAHTARPLRELTTEWVKPVLTVYPRPEYRQWYEDRYQIYRQVYKTVKDIPL